MATQLQKKAVNILVEKGRSVSRAMREAGYSKNTAVVPQKLTESKGFMELCEEAGLTDNLLLNCLTEDIKKKKYNRKAELELGFKLKGHLKDNPQTNINFSLANLFQDEQTRHRDVRKDEGIPAFLHQDDVEPDTSTA